MAYRNGGNPRNRDTSREQTPNSRPSGGSSPPVYTARMGNLSVAVWARQTDDGEMLSITVKKSYFDKAANEWKETNYLFPNEAPVLAALLQQAFGFCTNVQNKE